MDSLFEKFNRYMKSGTPAEKRLARYYLEHPEDISFETAAAVADRLDLSPMTVGRFLRGAGIDAHAPAPPRLVPPTVETPTSIPGVGEPQRSFSHGPDQADVVQQVGALCQLPAWRAMVEEMARAQEVHIVAACASRPLAALFAWRLSEIRAGVHHLDGSDGIYMELLGNARHGGLLVTLDGPSDVSGLDRLRAVARKAGHRLLSLTYTERKDLAGLGDIVVRLPAAHRGTGLDPLATTALIELVVQAVADLRGAEAQERARRMIELRSYFARTEDGAA